MKNGRVKNKSFSCVLFLNTTACHHRIHIPEALSALRYMQALINLIKYLPLIHQVSKWISMRKQYMLIYFLQELPILLLSSLLIRFISMQQYIRSLKLLIA